MAEEKKMVIEFSDSNFDSEVNNSALPVLVDFWAPWCGPCRMLAPIVERLAEKFAGKMKVGKVNVDENPNIAARFGIMSIPTLILFKGGKEVERVIGAMPEPVLSEKFAGFLV